MVALIMIISAATWMRAAVQNPVAMPVDHAVAEAVMTDLLDKPLNGISTIYEVQFSPIALKSERVWAFKLTANFILNGHKSKDWKTVSQGIVEKATEAANNVVFRREDANAFKGYRPKDRRIKLFVDDPTQRPLFWAPQAFFAYPPGYSNDHTVAILYLGFSWSGGRHPGNAAYVLVLRNGKWVVLVRDVVLIV